ncbi:MAG: hypothetical protein PF569_00225 [Candidatus Woesearchaeota archaeon]|jgi:hypothetical protein|nr:hypothetical protein [Candidatus Woesearchaeota archaeon]
MEQLKEIKNSLENIEISSEDSIFTLLLISDLLEDVIQKEDEATKRRAKVEEALKTPTFKDALGVVLDRLRNDEDFFNAYTANIAMDVFDAFQKNEINFPQLIDVSNQAAQNFMNRWTGK